MNNIALSLHDLSFSYMDIGENAINGISLAIPSGKITAILGPNGAGKSTLLLLLLGYNKPKNGEITILDKPIQSYPRRELSQLMGIVPQWEPSLFNFTVFEYVMLGRAPYLSPLQMPTEDDADLALSIICKLGIDHLTQRPISELSGGERQIVLFARILAQDTSILLLDEPTSHLDLSNQAAILRILDELTKLGKTIIFTTHDPNIATLSADSIVLMKNGQIYDQGSIDEVLTAEKLAAIYQTTIIVEKVNDKTVVLLDKNNRWNQQNK